MHMRRFVTTISLAAAAITASTASFAGDCQKVAAVGDGLTKDIAVVMSTHGLANIIEAKGLKGSGPVKTTCEPNSVLTQCHSSQTACK